MGTKEDYSLIPDSGRLQAPILNPPGNWEFIAQYFQFWELSGATLALANVDASAFDNALYFLFFGHDRPLLGQACSYYDDVVLTDSNTDTLTLPEPTHCEAVFPQSDPSLLSAFVTANETSLEVGQEMTGETVTNSVDVNGYPIRIDLLDRSYVDGEAASVDPVIKGHILCSGSILHGQPFAQGMQGVNTQVPIILAEPDYTQAMKDAGNRVTQGTTDLIIVGLWEGNAR